MVFGRPGGTRVATSLRARRGDGRRGGHGRAHVVRDPRRSGCRGRYGFGDRSARRGDARPRHDRGIALSQPPGHARRRGTLPASEETRCGARRGCRGADRRARARRAPKDALTGDERRPHSRCGRRRRLCRLCRLGSQGAAGGEAEGQGGARRHAGHDLDATSPVYGTARSHSSAHTPTGSSTRSRADRPGRSTWRSVWSRAQISDVSSRPCTRSSASKRR